MVEELQVHTVGKCTNKYLATLWDARSYARHIQRLHTVKPAVDNHVVDYRHSNAKGHRTMIDHAAEVDRKNKQLLDKLVQIYQRSNETHSDASRRNNPFLEMRVKEMKRIHHDNQMIVNRITSISSQSAYSRKRLQQERAENLSHAQRISHFPRRFRQRHPELPSSAQTRKTSARKMRNRSLTPSRTHRGGLEEQADLEDEYRKIRLDSDGSVTSDGELGNHIRDKSLGCETKKSASGNSCSHSATSLCSRRGLSADQAVKGTSGMSAK